MTLAGVLAWSAGASWPRARQEHRIGRPFWANYKVVQYAGRSWDPSYNLIFNAFPSLTLYQITLNDVAIEGVTYHPFRVHHSVLMDGKDWHPSDLLGAWRVDSRPDHP